MKIIKALTFLLLGIITTIMLMGADKRSNEYVPDFQAISFKDIQM